MNYLHTYLRMVCATILVVVLFGPTGADTARAQNEEPTVTDKRPEHYLVKLLGTREGWPNDMTDDELRVMSEHFVYLKDLTKRGKVLMAGPVFDQFGLIVLEVASREEADRIMANEPSIVQGVHTYDMHPMVASLQASTVPAWRYVEVRGDRKLVKEVTVAATLDEVWRCWTTAEGVESFIAPKANIELRPGGAYEWLFDLSAPPGQEGGNGCRVLSVLPMEMMSFEWNAPPRFDDRRYTYTWVVVQFEAAVEGSVTVRLTHLGWGDTPAWQEVYDYFDSAWGYVLDRLKQHLES
ncbi:hypothetical protein GF420_00330 [candidate division GN15 bacterium]|nr:hypothetical protein [candidate division GN15 bacterium]